MPSLDTERHVRALSFLLGQSSSLATLCPAPVNSVPRTCLGRSPPPCPGPVPALGLPGPASGTHGAWPEAEQPSGDCVTDKWASPVWVAAVSLVLPRKKKQSVARLASLSPGYQSCREAVAAHYSCPEAPLEAQVLVPSTGTPMATQQCCCPCLHHTCPGSLPCLAVGPELWTAHGLVPQWPPAALIPCPKPFSCTLLRRRLSSSAVGGLTSSIRLCSSLSG